jgi:hypothetical protein
LAISDKQRDVLVALVEVHISQALGFVFDERKRDRLMHEPLSRHGRSKMKFITPGGLRPRGLAAARAERERAHVAASGHCKRTINLSTPRQAMTRESNAGTLLSRRVSHTVLIRFP